MGNVYIGAIVICRWRISGGRAMDCGVVSIEYAGEEFGNGSLLTRCKRMGLED